MHLFPLSARPGMARKRSERSARAEEEGIASGMLDIHQLARKRRAEADAARERDPGLREDNGAFRHGVLRLNMGSSGSRGRRPSRGRGGRGRGGGRGGGRGRRGRG